VCVCIYIYTHICIHICMCIYTCVWMHIAHLLSIFDPVITRYSLMYKSSIYVHTYIYIRVWVYIFTHIFVYIYVCIFISVYGCVSHTSWAHSNLCEWGIRQLAHPHPPDAQKREHLDTDAAFLCVCVCVCVCVLVRICLHPCMSIYSDTYRRPKTCALGCRRSVSLYMLMCVY